jgi:hypothetical protein
MQREKGAARRERIVSMLRVSDVPVTGTELSSLTGVSRQAIVNDIAILRAAGKPIQGSPRGYVLVETRQPGVAAVLACSHDREGSRRELETLVAHGLEVQDVVVEHPLYGEVRANLMISSHDDVERYMRALQEQNAQPLSSLTGGVHLHHVRAPNHAALDAARKELASLGMIVED